MSISGAIGKEDRSTNMQYANGRKKSLKHSFFTFVMKRPKIFGKTISFFN